MTISGGGAGGYLEIKRDVLIFEKRTGKQFISLLITDYKN
jgi:hypothetical protein